MRLATLELNSSKKSITLLKDIGVGVACVAWFLSWRLSCSPYTPHTPPAALFLPPALARVRAWSKGSTSARQVQQGRPDVRWATGVTDSLCEQWVFWTVWIGDCMSSMLYRLFGWVIGWVSNKFYMQLRFIQTYDLNCFLNVKYQQLLCLYFAYWEAWCCTVCEDVFMLSEYELK